MEWVRDFSVGTVFLVAGIAAVVAVAVATGAPCLLFVLAAWRFEAGWARGV